MENNEIMKNEEVMEATEEIATADSGKGLMVVAGIGLVVLAGGIIYKYVAKPMIAKAKAKKEQKATIIEATDFEVEDVEENIEETK